MENDDDVQSCDDLRFQLMSAIGAGQLNEVDRVVTEMVAAQTRTPARVSPTEMTDMLNVGGVLHSAVASGHVPIVELLLSKLDIDVNMVHRTKGTPLHVAVKLQPESAVRMCELLIDRGADISVVGRRTERTPLQAACEMSSSPRRLIELLTDHRTVHYKGPSIACSIPHLSCVRSRNVAALEALFDFEECSEVELDDGDIHAVASQIASNGSTDFSALMFRKLQHRARRGIAIKDNGEWGWSRVLHSACRNYGGETRRAWTAFLLQEGVCPIMAFNHIIKHRLQDLFDLFLPYMTPAVVARIHALQPMSPWGDNLRFRTVVKACEEQWQLETVLDLGIEFTSLQQELRHYQSLGLDYMNLYCNLRLHHYRYCKLLSHLILWHSPNDLDGENCYPFVQCRESSECSVKNRDDYEVGFQQVIQVLLQHGAQPNAEAENQMPPLCALAFMKTERTYAKINPLYNTARALIRAGANPFYRTGFFGGCVSRNVPDVLLIAALVGNVQFVHFLLSRVGYDGGTLIRALREQIGQLSIYQSLNLQEKVTFGCTVVTTLKAILPFTIKHDSGVKNSCDNIRNRLRCHMRTDRHTLDTLEQEFSCVQSLQSLARVTIRSQLQRTVDISEMMYAKVKRIPSLPSLLKSFLLFDDTLT